MRKTRAKQLKKLAISITPKNGSVARVYRRIKRGYNLGHLHLSTINKLVPQA